MVVNLTYDLEHISRSAELRICSEALAPKNLLGANQSKYLLQPEQIFAPSTGSSKSLDLYYSNAFTEYFFQG